MEQKIIKHGNHVINNDTDGYMYNFNTSQSYSFNSHLHSCYEFIHIIHGRLVYTVEGSEYWLSDGDFIMTNPSELHSFSFPAKCDYQREFLHVYPGFVKAYPELTSGLNARKIGYFNRFSKDIAEKYEIDKIFKEIEKCCSAPKPETDFEVLGLTLLLLSKINQALRKEAPEHQAVIKNKKTNEICEYIDRHFMEGISVESIVSSRFISQSQLSRAFKKETGMTIKTYLNMRKIRHAKNLIMEGNHMIKNIYMDCGFENYSTFYRAFVKYVGMSPEEFKKMHEHPKASENNQII